MLMISDSIFIENSAFRQKVESEPVKLCFEEGKSISGMTYPDYRGIDIFGISYCENDLGFVMLTEVDESVVLEPIYELQEKIIILGVTIMAIASGVSFVLSKRISDPIKKLKLATQEISKGNFDVKTKIQTNDEIQELSESFDVMAKTIKETVSAITHREDIIKRQEKLLSQFSKEEKNCSVCLVDIIGSLAISKTMSDEQNKRYYEIFTGSVLEIIKKHKGIPVKLINDSILFYFPSGSYQDESKTIECCLEIADASKEMNDKLSSENLPGVGYRISSTLGDLQVVHNNDGSIDDIFGDSVSLCFKINQYALPNGLIIAKAMYEKSKSLDFKFTKLENSLIQELQFDLYLVSR